MTNPLIIKKFWALKAKNTASALTELKQQLSMLGALPEIVTLVSAGEVKPLLDPDVINFCQWLKHRTRIQFISVACVSIHGALLEFFHSERTHGLVVSLEISQSLQQDCLNSLGIGTEPDQDGLNVIGGVGFVELCRNQNYGGNDMVVRDCQIFSQPQGLGGITQVIARLAGYLEDIDEDTIPVSFEISSNWGKKLSKGLTSKLQKSHKVKNWLPSIELDGFHYLSLKPLYELNKYQSMMTKKSLLIFTLGGGGRVGWLQLSKQKNVSSNLPEASYREYSCSDDLNSYNKATELKQDNKEDYYQKIRTTLKYPQSLYRGIHNYYFQWPMSKLPLNLGHHNVRK